ncbi:MAG: ankyrin repeat domain-containing protein [Armatimonadota bacterium]
MNRIERAAPPGATQTAGRPRRWLWPLLGLVIVAGLWGVVTTVERPRYLTLHEAIRAGDLDDVRYHLEQGADLRDLDEGGYTGLHTAAVSGQAEIAAFLLSKGLEPDVRDPERTISNYTALHLAARDNSAEVAAVLLEAGADPNARDSRGRTPLHMAAMNNSADAARVALTYGAEPNLRDDNGMTPLGLAVRWEKAQVGRVMVQHGAVQ